MGLIANLKFVGQMLTGVGVSDCEHTAALRDFDTAPHECGDCLRAGVKWFHLRMCMTCGYVGCCDSSKLKHISLHARETGHPITRSIERGESWLWCYQHQRLVRRRL